MPKYTIELKYSGYQNYEIEADDLFDAEEQALCEAERDFTRYQNIEVTDSEEIEEFEPEDALGETQYQLEVTG